MSLAFSDILSPLSSLTLHLFPQVVNLESTMALTFGP